MRIWYVYPQWHTVSFTLIARKHIEELRKYMIVTEIDELAFPTITPHSRPFVFIHPYFYIAFRCGQRLEQTFFKYKAIIGVDVADSDRISQLAVTMTNYTAAMIVPSRYAEQAYRRSGVNVPIHVIPHALDLNWYEAPKVELDVFFRLKKLKEERKEVFLLYFLIHSDYRKGADLVVDFYSKLKKARPNVRLIIKTMTEDGPYQDIVRRMGGIVVSGWLNESQKMALYDLCDIYPLFSRGGGFEHNGLEALGRELVVIAPKGGAWEEYMPCWGLVESHPCPYVLKNNPIHVGKGVEIDVDKAVDLAVKIVDNLDKYKEMVRKYKESVLKKRFTWVRVGEMLRDIVRKYW